MYVCAIVVFPHVTVKLTIRSEHAFIIPVYMIRARCILVTGTILLSQNPPPLTVVVRSTVFVSSAASYTSVEGSGTSSCNKLWNLHAQFHAVSGLVVRRWNGAL